MTSLLVIQPSEDDPPAKLGEWLTAAGATLQVVKADRDQVPTTAKGYHGVVCLGGGMGAGDDAEHPWLADVRELLRAAVAARVPTLAVCLGAQLLAIATGGQVELGAEGPEVGAGLVAKRDLAWTDPLFADLPFMPDVVQFHHDVVTRLPANAAVLASSHRYPNQAFRIGPTAYGVQFHIETTTELVLAWAAADPSAAARARPGELDRDRLDELHRDVEQTWQPFAARFVGLAAGTIAPVQPAAGPTLPIA